MGVASLVYVLSCCAIAVSTGVGMVAYGIGSMLLQ